tara:strand:- start:486 stop:1403 length:918 start_codon:yes stop_codon:yes gene_type:complete
MMGVLSANGCRIVLVALVTLVAACQTSRSSDEVRKQMRGGPIDQPSPALPLSGPEPLAEITAAEPAPASHAGAPVPFHPFDPGRGVGMFFVKSVTSFADSNGQATAHINYGMGVAIHHKSGECLILTNTHVVSGGTNNLISEWTGTPNVNVERMGRLAWASGEFDVAILVMPSTVENCAPVTIATTAAKPGEEVVAYGQPLPNLGVVTRGRIAGIWNIAELGLTILGDFRSAPGHSGSGVFRDDGSIIGLVTSKARDKEDFVYIMPICRIVEEIRRSSGQNASTPSSTDISAVATLLEPRCAQEH